MDGQSTPVVDVIPLRCEWASCANSFTDVVDLCRHVEGHCADFYPLPTEEYFQAVDSVHGESTSGLSCLWSGCGFVATTGFELLLHVSFHPQHTAMKAEGSKVQAKFQLPLCSLDSQTRNVIPEVSSPYVCQWKNCTELFQSPVFFYQHINDHIYQTDLLPRAEGALRCRVQCHWRGCSTTVQNRSKLKEHARSHTGERALACCVCGGLFSNRTKFKDHLTRQQSLEDGYYQCSHCCKRLPSERLLRDHMRQHVNSLKCTVCDMTCPSPAGLRKHMYFKHNTEKPFACTLCYFRCKTQADLRRHQETHNEVPVYLCSENDCGYRSKTFGQLRRHYVRTHKYSALLQQSKPQLYCCQVCQRTYIRGQDLTKHLERKHSFQHPSAHVRFRYMRGEDGFMYLQTMRFETVTDVGAEDAGETDDDFGEDIEEQLSTVVEQGDYGLAALAAVASTQTRASGETVENTLEFDDSTPLFEAIPNSAARVVLDPGSSGVSRECTAPCLQSKQAECSEDGSKDASIADNRSSVPVDCSSNASAADSLSSVPMECSINASNVASNTDAPSVECTGSDVTSDLQRRCAESSNDGGSSDDDVDLVEGQQTESRASDAMINMAALVSATSVLDSSGILNVPVLEGVDRQALLASGAALLVGLAEVTGQRVKDIVHLMTAPPDGLASSNGSAPADGLSATVVSADGSIDKASISGD